MPLPLTPPRKNIKQQLQDTLDSHKLWALQQQVDELEQEINETAGLDQYPGKTVPACFSLLYGPFASRTARRVAGVTHEGLAPLVDPTTFALPRNQNILVGRDGAWYWCATNLATYLSWTWTAPTGVGGGLVDPVRPAAGDIFSPVVEMNGGAQLWQVLGRAGTTFSTRIGFELDLYDRKRGRSLTNGRLPAEMWAGFGFGFRKLAEPQHFEEDTEIEPRLYLTELRMDDWGADFGSYSVAAYVNIVFRGYRVLG